ncbi:MAG TPA: T9SS type A sorting domain-containing protein [Chitinophagaceae bacterium]
MKTYPYTHARVVSLPHASILRKSIFLLFSTLITYIAFANSGSALTGDQENPSQTPAAEFSLPLVLKSFNATLVNKKVKLTWTTGHEKDLVYFVIERSTNGVDYSEAGFVFAAGNASLMQYSFPDVMPNASRGVIYYRLKMMDSRKRFQYSPVRLVRISETTATELQVVAYPNPVINELRITIPAAWQNKSVSYEVYNMSGHLVKRIAAAHASQTETLNVRELGKGTYVVKAFTQTEVAAQRIVKK